ncbi:unnamed protein product [Closterium sp. Yama58-4]|nr:unnamed protein product [Closterium sp. Yama58-4]
MPSIALRPAPRLRSSASSIIHCAPSPVAPIPCAFYSPPCSRHRGTEAQRRGRPVAFSPSLVACAPSTSFRDGQVRSVRTRHSGLSSPDHVTLGSALLWAVPRSVAPRAPMQPAVFAQPGTGMAKRLNDGVFCTAPLWHRRPLPLARRPASGGFSLCMARCGAAWSAVVLHGALWCCMARCGAAWRAVVLHGARLLTYPPTLSPIRPQPLLAATSPCRHWRLSPSAMATPAHHSVPPPPHAAEPSDAAKAELEARNERSTAEVAALRRSEVGVVVVDHGSRRPESNQQLDLFVGVFQQETGYSIVEPAHMEIAEPSIAVAFSRCVQRGARGVIVCPYFLSPGRHWQRDIPALAAEAAAQHGNRVPFIVTAPIGVHPLVARVLEQRIAHCLQRVASEDASIACDACRDGGGCMDQKLL